MKGRAGMSPQGIGEFRLFRAELVNGAIDHIRSEQQRVVVTIQRVSQ